MSAGGIFTLITSDGRADRMLMATEILDSRIRDIMALRELEIIAEKKRKISQYKHLIIWRAITQRNKIERARNKILYECVLDMLRMRIRDVNTGVRASMI